MRYLLTAAWDDGVAELTQRLICELASGKHVLWLVSGGSNIAASVAAMKNISEELGKNLTIALIDERYGPAGHRNSNFKQLQKAGFDANTAKLIPVLEDGLTLKQAATAYNATIKKLFTNSDSIIAQIGIGEDGHIAGILPDSPAAHETIKLVVGYENDPLDRITLTFPAIAQFTAVYAFAFGDTKSKALSDLKSRRLSPQSHPAQILKQLREVYIYNDQIGERT